MKVYFAASIRGGRQNVDDYEKIINFLLQKHTVLTEHISDTTLTSSGEDLKEHSIYNRDISYIKESDVIVAEVTVPSLGVGYEIAFAEALGKPVICLFNKAKNNNKLSAMISGNTNIDVLTYSTLEELFPLLGEL